MKGHSADRRWGFWLVDHGLALGGLALLAVGAATSWWAMTLGSSALAIAFFAWVAEADGLLPVDDLRFESYERSSYVTRGSLERSLSAAGL